jgi:hypothetical protein
MAGLTPYLLVGLGGFLGSQPCVEPGLQSRRTAGEPGVLTRRAALT